MNFIIPLDIFHVQIKKKNLSFDVFFFNVLKIIDLAKKNPTDNVIELFLKTYSRYPVSGWVFLTSFQVQSLMELTWKFLKRGIQSEVKHLRTTSKWC